MRRLVVLLAILLAVLLMVEIESRASQADVPPGFLSWARFHDFDRALLHSLHPALTDVTLVRQVRTLVPHPVDRRPRARRGAGASA